ncbi:hypothetical protein BASA83_012090 [Batrachochytrium salamandrivorans]|nr:hypothetical protein BASA83_012090 [Batrachochytrium salamandrivorans]
MISRCSTPSADTAGVTHVYGSHMVNDVRIANHQAAAHVKNGQVTSFSSSFARWQDRVCLQAPAAQQPRDQVGSGCGVMLPLARSSRPLISPTRLRTRPSQFLVVMPLKGSQWYLTLSFKGSSPNWVGFWHILRATTPSPQIPVAKPHHQLETVVFDTQFNSIGAPTSDANIAAAAVNLFYLTNVMHDISYQYGFTESAGNFQKNNFGRADKAMTLPLLINEHVSLQPVPVPIAILAFDNVIVAHEYTHGISNRLTGGPSTVSCLNQSDSAGMGEGWSDVIAMIVLAKSSDNPTTRVIIGAYATNHRDGIRSGPIHH